MRTLNIKPTSKQIKTYYAELDRLAGLGVTKETSVRAPFQTLLKECGREFDLTMFLEQPLKGRGGNQIFVDAALLGNYNLTHGYCEAKDVHDDLPTEVKRKLSLGYPRENIIFQTPQRAILWQNNQQVLDVDLTDPTQLVNVLQTFFAYRPQEYDEWEDAVAEFKDKVPTLGKGLAKRIQKVRKTNREFITAFADFHAKCCQSINPNLSEAAVEEMLIQHLLTERIFRTVFDSPAFTRRNVIANEIEKVIDALTSQSFSRREFLEDLNHFYVAIERAAALMSDYSQKQSFLNTVYEQFFQGFSVKVADTHGIVYTPQPIVDFMVRSVEYILQTIFDRLLSDSGVHIVDPFVGTGNFIVRIMQEIRSTALEYKYTNELHCNEVMLLPYYIASMNIEHEFYARTGIYLPFLGICLLDTFELAEARQFRMFTREITARVEKQRETDMFVIIGNPPYNVGQVNENDNNKNRRYDAMDARVAETYAKDSKATLKTKLYDPYVMAIRWALDRIGDEGVVAFVTNNSFLEGVAFDGMRKHLADDCDEIYILDLSGNARKGLKVSDANVFDIRVGVSINLFVKTKGNSSAQAARIFYHRTDEGWNKEQKFDFLRESKHIGNIAWQTIEPDARYTWLTEGLQPEFEDFVPIGTKEAKATKGEAVDVIFKTYSLGINTNRDAWARNFNRNALTENIEQMIGTYNAEVDRWKREGDRTENLDDFVLSDDMKIKWSRDLKVKLKRGITTQYAEHKVRTSLYRPFTKSNLYFDRTMNDVLSLFPSIYPTPETETENRVIIVSDHGFRAGFSTLMANLIPDLHTLSARDGFQCFPFYTYDEAGGNRRENITDWALAQFRTHYGDEAIGKWDIFHYVYALLHHPDYRERYEANLKRDLPRLSHAPDFWGFAKAGQRLGGIHVGYEEVEEYPLDFVETPDVQLDWRVEKMKLSKDKTQLVYNEFLTLDGIPAKAFEYRLGNRSVLEWVIDQYCVKTDKRSGIVNDPNREDAPQYIVKLIGKVLTVSLATVEIVEGLSGLGRFSDK